MAHFTKQTIQNLIKLSCIDCSEEEQESLLTDLEKIVTHIEQLDEVDTNDVPPCNHVLAGVANVMRDDIVGKTLPREVFLANAPSQIGGMIRVPPVLKNHSSEA